MASQSLHSSRIKGALALIAEGQQVLDIGCNDGAVSAELTQRGHNVLSADLPSVVGVAKSNFPGPKYLSFDASGKFPLADGCVDAVLATELIEHLVNDMSFLEECVRVLRCDGRLIISTPNLAYVGSRAYLLFGKYAEDPAHVRFYTFNTLRAKMEAVGLKVMAESGAVYDRGGDTFVNIVFRLRYGKQAALWRMLEQILPKTFSTTIIMCGKKQCQHLNRP